MSASRLSTAEPVVPEPPGTHHVYLVPGFFGFANLGELAYFGHVRDFLLAGFADRDVPVAVHEVETHPTATIQRRAARLLETIEATVGEKGPVHLVGHSAGSLDARLLLAPGAALGQPARSAEAIASRVQSLVSVVGPHRGTPLASFFEARGGASLLRLLSLLTVYVIRRHHVPLRVALEVVELASDLNRDRLRRNLIDQLYAELLSEFDRDGRSAVHDFFDEVAEDQGLMAQLTPAGAAALQTELAPRPGVRTGSVVARAASPSIRAALRIGLDLQGQAFYAMYRWLHLLTGPATDGIVPTPSQQLGEVLWSGAADHLDVIGHFEDPRAARPHYDWLPTGSHFDARRFEAIWGRVLDFILA